MAKKLTSEQAFKLSKAFHKLAVLLGDYRFDHWDEMKKSERTDLENMQWTLFNASSDLNAKAVVMKSKLLEDDLKLMMKAANKMQTAIEKVKRTKHVINIAAKAVAFAGAISTGDVKVTINAAMDLIDEINA